MIVSILKKNGYNIVSLINNDVISRKDLEGFSDELKETVRALLAQQTWDYSDGE